MGYESIGLPSGTMVLILLHVSGRHASIAVRAAAPWLASVVVRYYCGCLPTGERRNAKTVSVG